MDRPNVLGPLFREHEHVLALAARLRGLASGEEERAAVEFRSFWLREGEAHLQREEGVLPFAAVRAGVPRPLVERLVRGHRQLRQHADHVLGRIDAGGACTGCLAQMGGLLEDHVRLQERELFPALELASTVGDDPPAA
jgi:hypothetical protein